MKLARSSRTARGTAGKRGAWRRLGRALATLGLLTVCLGVFGWLMLPLVPLPRALFQSSQSLELVDRHGEPLRQVVNAETVHQRPVAFEAIPDTLIQATIAAEDQRFWRHQGADFLAYLRAASGILKHGRPVSGGSTISQQLIKLAHPRPRTVRTKVLEAVQAMRLEQVWDKKRILNAYLNRLDYGNRNRGCAAAAKYYFDKPLSDLTVAEAALLAGLPQGPSRLNPHRHRHRAVRRQQWILRRMHRLGYLNQGEYKRALQMPLQFAAPGRPFEASHFTDLVLRETPQVEGRLQTTLDRRLNRFVEETVTQTLNGLADRRVSQAAVVVLDNASGNVMAWVGSADFFDPDEGQVNGVLARRSPGSALKPFTYLLALEQGHTPATLAADVPVEFSTASGLFIPVNYDRRFYGPVRYRVALASSLNVAAVRVLEAVGGPAALKRRLQDCGITTLDQPPHHYGLGLTIGNAEVCLLELANAYACLARLGIHRSVRLTRDTPHLLARVADADAAWLIADMLKDNHARSLAFGLDSPLKLPFPVACKTGTSSDFRDNWAFGFTPEFTVGVWVGNFDGSPMAAVSGVSGAAPILREVFVYLHREFGTSWYAQPSTIVSHRIDPISGKSWSGPGGIREFFTLAAGPEAMRPGDRDEQGRIRLSSEYRDWYFSGDNWVGERVVLANPDPVLQLVSPLPGTIYYIDPELPLDAHRFRLKARAPGNVAWASDSLNLVDTAEGTVAVMDIGRHRLTVECGRTGQRMETWIEIRSL